MANTFTCLHYHLIFSTKNRKPWITPDIEQRIWEYLGGIARTNNMKALQIGGIEDHVHVVTGIPPSLAVSKALQLLKGASSKWIHETFPNMAGFEWQDGYGAFTVEGVARRAGVSKATVYRHWDGKLELVADAVGRLKHSVHPPETDDHRERITGMLRRIAEMLSGSRFAACVPAVISAAQRDEGLREFHHSSSAERRRLPVRARSSQPVSFLAHALFRHYRPRRACD